MYNDDNFGLIICSAMRYAMGRNSYIVPVVQEWIISHWKSFDERTQKLIERDLKYFLENEMTVQEKDKWEYLYKFVQS